MPFLSVNLSVLAFADSVKSNTPDIRLADIKWSLQGLPTNNFKQIPLAVAPGETLTLTSTARAIEYYSFTQFIVEKQESLMRIKGSFKQSQVKHSGATEWTLTRNPLNGVSKLEAVGGVAAALITVNSMDTLELDIGFHVRNRGQFAILKATSTTIEFINDLGQTEDSNIIGNVTIFSKKIQVNDIIDITSAEFAFPNRGSFPVSKVGADYIEIVNPNAFPETVTNVSPSGIVVYPFAYKWMLVAVDHKVLCGLNGSAPTSIEIEPPVEGDIGKNPGLFMKRGKVFEVSFYNSGIETVNGFLILAE